MKRFHTLMTMVAIAMLSFTVTSCETDEDIADAEARLARFAPFIERCFPETVRS